MDSTIIPRGIRNKNPLNIIQSNNRWVGRSVSQTDPTFVQFDNIEYGIRAAFILCRTYQKKYHIRLLKDLITRWCPDATAPTYIDAVCRYTTFKPTTTIDIKNKNQMCMILHAMAKVENGVEVPMHHFLNGYALAFSNKFNDTE